jgi:hypothetical protein
MSDLDTNRVVCKTCGRENGPGATICTHCGAAIAEGSDLDGGGVGASQSSPSSNAPPDAAPPPPSDAAPPPDAGVFADEEGEPERFDELADTEPSTGEEEQRRQQRMVLFSAIGAGVLAVLALGVGAWFLLSSGALDPLLAGLPVVGNGAPPTVTATPEDDRAATAVANATQAAQTPAPTLTPEATSEATPVPTMVPIQVQVEGPTAFPDAAFPYKARYDVTLKRGEQQGAALLCDGCLKADENAKIAGQIQRGETTTFEVIAPPLEEVSLVLMVEGSECTTWTLAPSNEEATMQAVCSPQGVVQ